jgi:hypothetical protein
MLIVIPVVSGRFNKIIFSLYWMQFSFNFVVYAASNKQYREAYLLFLQNFIFCHHRGSRGAINDQASRDS